MAKYRLKDAIKTVLILAISFLVLLPAQEDFETYSLIPTVFVLASFLVSLTTQGYIWGVVASLLGVLAVNFAFTFPYFEFNFSIPENVFAAMAMLCVAIITSTLTTKIKQQEKVKAESETEKMRANLLRAISHDLRTPLTSIYGSSSAIIENYDLLKKEQKLKLLGEIQEDAQWLIHMVENLLSVTRIDGGQVSLVKSSTVLEELIDAVLVQFHKRYPEQEVDVEIPDGFISIPIDALLIEQVIMNILENAVYHAKGMTHLSLRVFTRENYAVFEIADNGCGIAKEKLSHLFTGSYGGTAAPADGGRHNMGIGLSVCSAIIKAHGGDIQAENLKSGGALFRFSLQMEEADHEQ